MLAPSQLQHVSPISVSESIGQVHALLVEHWHEVAKNKQLMVLKPNLPAYERLEAAGMLISLGAFVGAEMVGYSVSTVQPHLHYADLVYAQNDVLFVREQHRGRLGLKLIRETERAAKDRGARMMMWHAKPGTTLDLLLPRLGYGIQDVIYAREV